MEGELPASAKGEEKVHVVKVTVIVTVNGFKTFDTSQIK